MVDEDAELKNIEVLVLPDNDISLIHISVE